MIYFHLVKIIVVTTLITGLTACNIQLPKNKTLLDAEAAYRDAKNQPELISYAAPELDKAKKALDQASNAKTPDMMNSLAYVATNEIKTAKAIAEKEAYEVLFMELSKEKDKLIMDALKKDLKARSTPKKPQKKTQDELELVNAIQTDRGLVMTVGNVLFKTEQADLLPGAENSISQIADFLQKHPDKTVQIEGHTDSAGSSSLNQQLSENRAWSVRNALINQGISADRINAVGLGSSRPVASNSSEEGRQKNSRVEVILPN